MNYYVKLIALINSLILSWRSGNQEGISDPEWKTMK